MADGNRTASTPTEGSQAAIAEHDRETGAEAMPGVTPNSARRIGSTGWE